MSAEEALVVIKSELITTHNKSQTLKAIETEKEDLE